MKTIEERAREYEILHIGHGKDFCVEDFILGAESEHEELTRWNENLDEVPDGCNQWCIVKIQDKDGFVSYTVALALWGKFSMPDLMNGEKILGWREIHE